MYVAGGAGVVLILVVLLVIAVLPESNAASPNPYDNPNNSASDPGRTSRPKPSAPVYDWTKDPDNIKEFNVPDTKQECLTMSRDLESNTLFKRSAKCLYQYGEYIAREAEAVQGDDDRKKELFEEAVSVLERAAEIADKGYFGKDLADTIRRRSSIVNSKKYGLFKHGTLNYEQMKREHEEGKRD